MTPEPGPTTPISKTAPDDDLFVIREAFGRLRAYRRFIALSILAVALLASSVAFIIYQRAPTDEVAGIRFHLLFEAAARNQYPNGAPFSPADITADRLLLRVYQRNELQRYIDYDTFKSSVFVVDERATSTGGLSVSMRREGGVAAMPPELMDKVLTDTLVTWADDVNQTKAGYSVTSGLHASIDSDLLEREDFIVAAELLQSYVRRATQAVVELNQIPAARRLRAGTHQRSLADIQALLEDVNLLEIEPVLDSVRADGLSRNPDALRAYATSRRYRLRVAREQAEHLIKTLQQSLVAYDSGVWVDPPSAGRDDAATAPHTFLDRLLRRPPARSNTDTFRRALVTRFISENEQLGRLGRQEAYYSELVKTLDARAPRPSAAADRVVRANAHIDRAANRVIDALADISVIAGQLSDRDPAWYAVTSPFSITKKRAVSPRTAALFVVLSLLIAVILIPAACLIHSGVPREAIGAHVTGRV